MLKTDEKRSYPLQEVGRLQMKGREREQGMQVLLVKGPLAL
jgi:hypothetical protein